MKRKTLGILLIVIGVIMIAFGAFRYITTENVAKLGSVEINKEKTHTVKWPPIVGVIVFVAGCSILLMRKNVRKLKAYKF